MKKINIFISITKVLCVLLPSLFIMAACSQPTSTPSNQTPATSDNTTKSDSSDDSNSTDTQDTPESPAVSIPTQLQILLILPHNSTSSFSTEDWNDITFVSGNDLYNWQNAFTSSADCQIEIMEHGNENNINLEAVVYSDKVSVKSDEEGTVYFRIKNTNANLVTNYTAVTFLDNSSSESNTEVRFVGTWHTNYTQGLIDTIDFYSDGTGYCHNSRYPNSGGNNFRWSVKDSSTLNITNSLGSTGTCSYSFIGESLVLTNFMGLPRNTAVTFTKF